jgi:Kelch motif protein
MHRSFRTLDKVKLAVLLAATLAFVAGCGGGGGSEGGDKEGTDTAPEIIGLQTPSGLQGTRGADPDHGRVALLYSIRDREYDWTYITVEYGVDQNGDNLITDGSPDALGVPTLNEFAPATPAPETDADGKKVHDGVGPLNSSPGAGALHAFVWDSVADIGTDRRMTQDYVFTDDGRIAKDPITGDLLFNTALPGVVVRITPESGALTGHETDSNAMSVNNNNVPVVEVQAVADPVSEDVAVNWMAIDPDSDSVTIAVDYTVIEDVNNVPTSPEELEALAWLPALNSDAIGEGTALLSASPAPGRAHVFGWDSLGNVAQQRIPILLRFRPLDQKDEFGEWSYQPVFFALDNYTTFMEPVTGATLLEGRVGAQATTLDTGNVLVTGGSATSGGGGLNGGAVYFVLPTNPYGNVAATANTMASGRSHHTATRLMAEDPASPSDPIAPAKVLITGGYDENGNPLDSAEIYDPSTSQFTPLDGFMSTPRAGHSAVLLRSGKVLIVGGVADANETASSFLDTAEIFDPTDGSFTLVEDGGATDKVMTMARADAGALLMPTAETSLEDTGSGGTDLVLIVGGRDAQGALGSIEVFDALTETFLQTDTANDMAEARWGMSVSATMEAGYPAVVAGGMASPPKATIEVFDQASREWITSVATMQDPRAFHSGALTGDGRVLFAGGIVNEAGTLFADSADLYNVALEMAMVEAGTPPAPEDADDFLVSPNGALKYACSAAAVTVLENGFVALFGGNTAAGSSDKIQLFAPEQGFNTPPVVEIRSPDASKLEPWAFGVLIYYRLIDAELDPARIVAQYKVLPSSNPGDATLSAPWTGERAGDLGKWIPATMQSSTVLGDTSSGTSGLATREDAVDSRQNPINNPDSDNPDDLGEHLFIWNSRLDIKKGNYDNVFFRIISYGAVEGGQATTSRFGMTKNAPVIIRIQPPVEQVIGGEGSVHGNVVFPFYLQDSDSDGALGATTNDLASVVWWYGIDLDGDGAVVELRNDDGDIISDERWMPATQAAYGETLNGTPYPKEDQSALTSLASGNPDVNGYPQGKEHWFIWDSVYDLGVMGLDPATGEYSRSDIFMRAVPSDYPADGSGTESEGIIQIQGNSPDWPFVLERDPEGLWIESWSPTVNNSDTTAPYDFNGVKVDEPIEFIFTGEVDPLTVNLNTMLITRYGSAEQVDGFYFVENSGGKATVTFYPQVQELPALPSGTLLENTGYSVETIGYDPENRSRPIIHRLGADSANTNGYVLTTAEEIPQAFKTGYGAVANSVKPINTGATPTDGASDISTSTSSITLRIDDLLDPASVSGAHFQAYTEVVPGVTSVVSGAFGLKNVVDDNGPGGTVQKYSLLSMNLPTGTFLPPDAKIFIVTTSGLTDLYGNPLSNPETISFKTATKTSTVTAQLSEGFSNSTNCDTTLTTAWWGTTIPAGSTSVDPNAQSGYLKGLFDYGGGTLGALTSSTTLSASSATNNTFDYTYVNLPYGYTISLRGDYPIKIRVQGDVTINGTIDGYGRYGADGRYRTSASSFYAPRGGAGYAGGGEGGGYQYFQYSSGFTSPARGADGWPARGFTTGQGKGGSSYRYTSYMTCFPGGGGGGGHAQKGEDGDLGGYRSTKFTIPGYGGAAYGSKTLANGPEGGAGGASGGHYVYSNYYLFYGSRGGGGGGGLGIYCPGTMTFGSNARVLLHGGDGGVYYFYTGYGYTHNGLGGGGAGGSLDLLAEDYNISPTAELDLRGGRGGTWFQGESQRYNNMGGDGSGGRLVIASGVAPTTIGVNGAFTTGVSTVSVGGSSPTNWSVTSNTVVDTDKPPAGVGWDASSGEFRVNNFTVAAGVILDVKGSKPLKVIASGNVDISGMIRSNGVDGNQHRYTATVYSNQSYWHIFMGDWNDQYSYTYYWPGNGYAAPGGAGGGQGGEVSNYTSSMTRYTHTYSYYYHFPNFPAATDGYGWDGKLSGKGAGRGGKAVSRRYSSYYYYYYGGAGAGGTGGEPGADGWSNYSSSYGGGTPGGARYADLIDLSSLTPSTITGGAGGGGGVVGGRRYTYTTGYKYPYGAFGGQGGGGGGGVGIAARGTIKLAGAIVAAGGKGGDWMYYYSHHTGAGGGGSGGNVLLHTNTGFDFDGGVIDVAGGRGGINKYYTYTSTSYYSYVGSRGGEGGRGAVRLTSSVSNPSPQLPLDGDVIKIGNGSVVTKVVIPPRSAYSKWMDTAAFVPKNFYWSYSGNAGIGAAYLQGAQSDPNTGLVDTGTTTAWVNLSSGSSTTILDGYRFFRFRIELKGVSGTYPTIDTFTAHWQYDK